MRLTVFYHEWHGGQWQVPRAEFEAALRESEFPGCVIVWANSCEAETLNELRQFAQEDDGAILYAHTKGAYSVSGMRDRWRRSMTNRVVLGWRMNLEWLGSGDFDAVGCHWLTEAEFPGMFGPMTVPAPGSGFFGGNFWMATSAYLRGLPECELEPRWKAESWIGINKPRVVDLLPGWPHDNRWPELCT